MAMLVHPESLLGRLRMLPDPRRRQARQYPLPSLLAALILGALNGQTSGFGAWSWARAHWSARWQPVGFRSPHGPVSTTGWTVLQQLDAEQLDRRISGWLEEVRGQPAGGVSVDGQTRRGRRRGALPGLTLVAMGQHALGTGVRQGALAEGEGDVAAAMALVREAPLQGRVVTRDAGLMSAGATQIITERGGDYGGVVQEHQPVVKAVRAAWVQHDVISPLRVARSRRADGRQRPRAEGNP